MKETIDKFYTAFSQKDWQTMQSCYHESATFSDPVFQDLTALETKAMWHMLTTSAKELAVSYHSIEVNGTTVTCHWEAIYDFSRTGRHVHNKIKAHFTFKDGKILSHRDSFNLWKWAGMALGTSGKFLGWTPMVQGKIRLTAKAGLLKFMEKHTEYC
jgi:ketosteroid isomerase-like protein